MTCPIRTRIGTLLSAAVLILAPLPALAGDVVVFAAASLKDAMDEITAAWQSETGNKAVVSLAGSSALARQIEAGAPADVFISANVAWMDELEEKGLVRSETRLDLLANSLVLIGHGKDAPPVEIDAALDLPAMLGDGRLAMAMVDSVPAGIYGKAALEALGLWDAVATDVAQTDNVRAALALVALGEAPLGIVYRTDAMAEPGVAEVGRFPADSHPPIIYPAAVTTASTVPEAEEFLTYLQGPEAVAIFRKLGFDLVGQAADDVRSGS